MRRINLQFPPLLPCCLPHLLSRCLRLFLLLCLWNACRPLPCMLEYRLGPKSVLSEVTLGVEPCFHIFLRRGRKFRTLGSLQSGGQCNTVGTDEVGLALPAGA